MKRYYLTDIVGDGTKGNPYRPKIPDGFNFVAVIDKPTRPWAFVLVAALDHSALLADPTVRALPPAIATDPDGPLTIPEKAQVDAALLAKGHVNPSISASLHREAIREVGKFIHPYFHESNLNVSE